MTNHPDKATPQPASANLAASQGLEDGPVNVDGYYGERMRSLNLPGLLGLHHTEVYFDALVGDADQEAIIGLVRPEELGLPGTEGASYVLIDTSEIKDAAQGPTTFYTRQLSDDFLNSAGEFSVGKRLDTGSGSEPHRITGITVVDTSAKRPDGSLDSVPPSDVRTRFRDLIFA